MAVNISLRQFADDQLVDKIRAMLDSAGVAPGSLEIEVTESLAATGSTDVVRTLSALQALGVSATLDDFCSGYSSLSRLRDFPVRKLKLDGTFVAPIASTGEARRLIESVIGMAHTMGLLALAEGVETMEQFKNLSEVGCDLVQGYLFLPAVPAATFSQMLANQSSVAAA